MPNKLKIAVSSCLLGNKVRWRGDHKKNRAVTEYLVKYCKLIPVCPETEIGMGVPREPVNLEGDYRNPNMIGADSRIDWTEKMQRYSIDKVIKLERAGVSGFIFKGNSPSCGMIRIPVYGNIGRPPLKGVGIFAKTTVLRLNNVPVIEEQSLRKSDDRKLFIINAYLYNSIYPHNWKTRTQTDIQKLFKPFDEAFGHDNNYLAERSRYIEFDTKQYPVTFRRKVLEYLSSLVSRENISPLFKMIENKLK